jgi:Family of unknown function (DUF5662)
MNKRDREQKVANQTIEKIRSITRHIRNVQDNCILLGEALINRGDIDLGHKLIANGFMHDVSKFSGAEWEYMAPVNVVTEDTAKLKLKIAVQHHIKVNPHHPEYWGHITLMPNIYLAEMVCDIKARSEEFGTDLRDWINTVATKKYGFSDKDDVYIKIMKYVNMICPTPFENISK